MSKKSLPVRIEANAFTGKGTVEGALSRQVLQWALGHEPPRVRTWLKAPPDADPRDWTSNRVGWGVVLPDDPHAAAGEASDAPEPIRELVAKRSETMGTPTPVLRYKAGPEHTGCLFRDGERLPVSQSPCGTKAGAVPRYLVICATPDQIPWQVQYDLNASRRCVGRLPLQGSGLENYVHALLDNWSHAGADPHTALVWATQQTPTDITALMRNAIAEPVVAKLRGDEEMRERLCYLDGRAPDGATAAGLAHELAARHPAFILTTSEGMTGPLDDVEQMRAQLGYLVDNTMQQLVGPDTVLKDWQPDGAIWYAHACCSAGSDSGSVFESLFDPESDAADMLRGLARCGAQVAPLPLALLGAARPARAFIGHVEPTFSFTLAQKQTAQFTTAPLTEALYDKLFQPLPVGHALEALYAPIGGLYAAYDHAKQMASEADMLYRLTVVRDLQGTVILGDPTVTLAL